MGLIHVLLLLSVNTANFVVWAALEEVTFTLDFIRADLEAIEKYKSKKPGVLEAIVRWPEGISFLISTKNEGYLVIEGPLKIENIVPNPYGSNLYFKNGMFHGFNTKDCCLDPISSQLSVTYKIGRIPKPSTTHFVSISYFSLEEIEKLIAPSYTANKAHIESYLTKLPTTFLAKAMDPYPFMVEYIMWTRKTDFRGADGNVRTLTEYTRFQGSRLILSDSLERLKLGLHGDYGSLTLYQDSETGNWEYPVKVFAVRMASTGFLAENLDYGVRFLSRSDLESGSPLPTEHKLLSNDFLAKLKKVEPRFSYGTHKVPTGSRPNRVEFQIQGHVLEKETNLRPGGYLDPRCPLYVSTTKPATPTKRICTDDSRMWLELADGTDLYLNDKEFTLNYSQDSLQTHLSCSS